MTAKVKATAIVKQFWMVIPFHQPLAIQCAIIHVKGIIEVTKPDPYPRKKTQMDREYWQEVLTELNKM